MTNKLINRLKNTGPGILVTAAFIGPGTVTACTLAGANYGYTLIWALVFATFATCVLQEMSARLGTIGQQGLGQALASELRNSPFKWPLGLLLLIALYGGNAAYEAGNLAGASLGIDAIVPVQLQENGVLRQMSIVLIAFFAGVVLLCSNYKAIERVLVSLVLLMALAFIATFIVVRPNLLSILSAIGRPQIPNGSLLTVIALIGTTVVPYNLFLHASAAKTRWQGKKNLTAARSDTLISIGLGGLLAILITSTAAASIFAKGLSISNASDMATQFEPLFGSLSKYLLGIGLFAAGLSSAITAPLATAYAITELMQPVSDDANLTQANTRVFRVISLSIILIGASIALIGIKPIKLILLAQFANGLLLPIVVCFLLYVMNQKAILDKHVNGRFANILGVVVVLFTIALGLKSILFSLNAF